MNGIMCEIIELDGTFVENWQMPHAPRCGEWMRIDGIEYAVRCVTYTDEDECCVKVERYRNMSNETNKNPT